MDNRTFTIELSSKAGMIGEETISDLAAWASMKCRGNDAIRFHIVRSDHKLAVVEISPASLDGQMPMAKRLGEVRKAAEEFCGLTCVTTGAR